MAVSQQPSTKAQSWKGTADEPPGGRVEWEESDACAVGPHSLCCLAAQRGGVSEYAHWGDRLGRGARELPGVIEMFQIGEAGGSTGECNCQNAPNGTPKRAFYYM